MKLRNIAGQHFRSGTFPGENMNHPDAYLNINGFAYAAATNILEKYEKVIHRMHGKCIDIGCGPGKVTKELLLPRLPSDATVVGVDVSEEMVKSANETYADERLGFRVLDIGTKSLGDFGQFDNVVSFCCLHWVLDQKQAYANISKLLKSNGEGAFLIVAKNPIFQAFEEICNKEKWAPYTKEEGSWTIKQSPYRHSDKPEVEVQTFLEDAGLRVLTCTAKADTFVFNDRAHLFAFQYGLNPYLNQMPSDRQDEFGEEMVEAILRHGYKEKDDGRIHGPIVFVHVHFQKK